MGLFQTTEPVPVPVVLALFAPPALWDNNREKQTGNSNTTLKMIGLETFYSLKPQKHMDGVMCFFNEDVFSSLIFY